ncbi:MAG: hypothetical protein A2087_14105 [Spirochaetes bacterium GWD1_61_31]|nr:MAG: hypothetical protein A2Y37_02055 [Spirochaetes bacterium GWB1_60_80]OHD33112.1 MAG: hypothetical protein A2004_12340 [Spirochaetes bacterium GWC1_61_12]OHD39578.1 MAG: hypothetical protein A2087_14105 [Spirochaetes bacterium GWD1_61_31]OHD43846.1 MAG: hypothetical protein A2Y35_00355 [Spirochaetes bacterium GWE1_60_18]OHD61166.1 MAG: hypothetical protein A2Y32_03615 [Spirochaetes bacterium GWF1_60_12]HAP44276.1 hypothetical protein [Spirochaetaceae bacterium]
MTGHFEEYSLVDAGASGLSLPWPASRAHGGGGLLAPQIRLSLRRVGDMTFQPESGNPGRDAWLRLQGFDPAASLALRLIHGRAVLIAGRPGELAGQSGDGIITANRTAHAVVTVADCLPIFIFDHRSGAFGVLHSGWQGTGILETAVDTLHAHFGSQPQELAVTLGPHIGTCCYTVDEGRAAEFASRFGGAAVDRSRGQPRLDLLAANLDLARRLGLVHIAFTRSCTCCHPQYGSYRRQGAAEFTRMAAVIGYPTILEAV